MKILAVLYLVFFVVLTASYVSTNNPNHSAMICGAALSLVAQAALYFYLFSRDRDKKETPSCSDLREGTVKKGGVNEPPTTPRPPPPVGEGGKIEEKR